jgi:hypothetical protein
MDYLVTADKHMRDKLRQQLKKVRIYSQKHPELKIELVKDKDALMNFLKSLI